MFGLVLAIIQATQSWFAYRSALKVAETQASNLVYILSAHMREAVAALDASLLQIAVANKRLDGPLKNSDDWQAVLTGAIAGMPTTGSLNVTDSDGIIRQSSIPGIVGQSRRELYIFQILAGRPDAGLMADKPFRSLSGEMLIPLARRLESRDGAFQGVAVATLRLHQLRNFYRSVDVGPGGVIRILHTEGKVLFREPSLRNPIDTPAFDDPVFRTYRRGIRDGHFEERTAGGRMQITAFHALPSPGMLVAVSLDREAALASWREDLVADGGLLAAEILALIVATATILQLLKAHQSSELQLAKQGRQLLLAESIANMGAVTFDLAAGTTRTSPNITSIFGLPEPVDEIPMEQLLAALHADDRPLLEEAIARCHRGEGPYRLEFRIECPDGAERVIWSEGFLDTGSRMDRPGVVAVCQDVTERRLAERQLVHSQKMEGLGQLTGGVAHDFNNLLTVISLNLEGLADMPGVDAEGREMAQAALLAADRGADLVRSLLAFARKQPLRPRVIDVNEIVRDTDHLLQRTLGEEISLETVPDPDVWPINVDPAQLQAAIVNLAVNARDSMERGGKLTIETSNTYLDEHYALQNPDVRPGAYVLVAVSDTGAGIPPEMLDRVFEPFFTTKELGKGTGLGLSMVYGFIKQSNGHIKIYSEVGHGTTVKLYLPRSEAMVEEAAPAAAIGATPSGGETVLVVEDDAPVRDFVTRHLQKLGYRTFSASTGADALETIDRMDRIDLLLTDVMLSGEMNGRQLVNEAERRRPGLKAIYMSGYAENALLHHGRLDPDVTLLSKPFRASELERKVRAAIGGNTTDVTA